METSIRIPMLFKCFLFSGVFFLNTEAALKTLFMEDFCSSYTFIPNYYKLDLSTETSGILMTVPQMSSEQEPFECTMVLVPGGTKYGVVLSLFRYALAPGDVLTIEDSDRYTIQLMGNGFFQDERKVVYSSGRMTIHYRRGNETQRFSTMSGGGSRPGFTFTFTRTGVDRSCYPESEFACNNTRCIAKSLVCDGHNHCGDRSEQQDCVPRASIEERRVVTPNLSIMMTIMVPTVAIFIVLVITLIVTCVRLRKINGLVTKLQDQSPGVPLEPVAPQGPAQPGSVFNRIRTSLRGLRRPVEQQPPEVPAPYHVPSMYPSLDHVPSAPHTHAATNPEFKADE